MSQDKDLTLLLANEPGYKALLAYLQDEYDRVTSDYTAAACTAVFNADARDGAVVLHGKRCMLDDLIRKLQSLRKGNTHEGN